VLQAIRENVIVQSNGLLTLRHPELPAGTEVEIVMIVKNTKRSSVEKSGMSMLQVLEPIHHIPISQRRSPEEQESYIEENRNQWD